MRYVIVGAGAVGCYYGGMLALTGQEVHFVARGNHDMLSKRGLSLSTEKGNHHLDSLFVHRSAQTLPKCDVMLVALKMTQLDALEPFVARALDEEGIVISLQNGLGAEERIANWVDAQRVFGAICFLCAVQMSPGHVQQTDRDTMIAAPFVSDAHSKNLEHLLRDLRRAAVDAKKGDDLELLRWRKLMWNVPYNGLCALLQRSTTEIGRETATRSLVIDIMKEVRAACHVVTGKELPSDLIEKLLQMTDSFDHYRPSMMLDRVSGRALELDAIYAEPISRAQGRGMEMPHTSTLFRLLRATEPRKPAPPHPS